MSDFSNLTLDWSHLTSISELEYNDKEEQFPGVYIWGFTIDKVFIPYYVGITKNLNYRIHEHIRFLISGLYTIYHKDSLAKFKDFKNKKDTEVKADNKEGIIYIPNWPTNFKKFLDERKLLQEHIDFMVETFTYSCAPVDLNMYTMDDLREIEKICIKEIGLENLANTKCGELKNLIKHKNYINFEDKLKEKI